MEKNHLISNLPKEDLPEDLYPLLNFADQDLYSIFFYQTIGSTNNQAKAFAREGYPHGTVIIADGQERGRGRLDRQWFSPRGLNIYMSVLFRPSRDVNLSRLTLITLATAIAVTLGIKDHVNIDVWPKWPNDIYAGSKKLGGILCESIISGGRIRSIVVGIGINVNMGVACLSDPIKDAATSIAIASSKVLSRGRLVCSILSYLRDCYHQFLTHSDEIIDHWSRLSKTLDSPVRVVTPEKEFYGKAIGLNPEGMLIVELENGDKKETKVVDTGDIIHAAWSN